MNQGADRLGQRDRVAQCPHREACFHPVADGVAGGVDVNRGVEQVRVVPIRCDIGCARQA